MNSGKKESEMRESGANHIAEEPVTLSRLIVAGGLLGAVGALLGGLIAGGFSILAVNAEAERNRQAFFLTERVEVYANLLAEAQAFQLAATRYNAQIEAGADDAAINAELTEASAKYDGVVASAWQVQVIATEPVGNAKEELARSMDQAWTLMVQNTAEAHEYFEGLDDLTRSLSRQFSDAAAAEFRAAD